MTQQNPPPSFSSAFAEYVHEQRNVIDHQWMKMVKQSPDVPDAMHISHDALQDHVPQLIDDLVERLRLEKEGPRPGAVDHSRSHGREQWKAGYNISELIWEIYIIRRVLTQTVLTEFAGQHPEYSRAENAHVESLIHDFFHRLTCDSVGQFIEEQQRVVQEKNVALEQTNRSRERLTRTVSHELRSVLNSLSMATTLLGQDATDAERQEMSAISTRMLADMGRILNDLLDFSTIVAGRARLTLERFSLPALCKEVVSEWRPMTKELGMTFTSKADGKLGEIVSDRLKIKRIAGNLLSNAIKYRKAAQGGEVSVAFSTDGETGWKMVVSDTGIGIGPEEMVLLFGEFNRIQPNSAVDGTGLGLAICKEYAELLGGQIEAFSAAEQGTRFEVRLPVSQATNNGSHVKVSWAS